MFNSFTDLKKIMDTMKTSLKETEREVNTVEVEEIKRLVKKYDFTIKDDIEDMDLILKYETLYDELNKYVSNKRKEISGVDEMVTALSGFVPGDNFSTILIKKKDNVNQIIDCINKIVERIKRIETTLYKNTIIKLNNMKVERYDIVKHPIRQVQIQQSIKTNDNEMNIINNSMNLLKQWSSKNTSKIIFDSKVNGNGYNNVLRNKINNKSNLYFIHFDKSNNVFGGYLNTKIDKSGDVFFGDKNAFVFSLIRNGKVNNKRYFLKHGEDMAFTLYNNKSFGLLYSFGIDIFVYKVGCNESWCTNGTNEKHDMYDYKNDNNPLTNITYPGIFVIKRIIILQMD